MTMKFDGGYNVMLEGTPAAGIAAYQKPDVLHLPLFSNRLEFSLLQVADGETVQKGQILARDPVNFSVPLLAPVGGTVNLEAAERHITLENLSAGPTAVEAVEGESQRQTLVRLGVWSSLARVDNNRVPDPENAPLALIVAVSRFEPYFPDADNLLGEAIPPFTSGRLADTEDGSACPRCRRSIPSTRRPSPPASAISTRQRPGPSTCRRS